MTKTGWMVLVVFPLLLVVGGIAFLNRETLYEKIFPKQDPIVVVEEKKTAPYGEVVLRVGETVTFAQNSIKLLRVFDDSRCPTGVQCVWAGTLKVEIESVTGMGTSTEVIELGKTLTTEAEQVTVVSVSPHPKAGEQIAQSSYIVTLNVSLRKKEPISSPLGACYVGGCSSQICSDQKDMVSTCEFREEYACYKTAECKRQADGKCGWTNTLELKSCLLKQQ